QALSARPPVRSGHGQRDHLAYSAARRAISRQGLRPSERRRRRDARRPAFQCVMTKRKGKGRHGTRLTRRARRGQRGLAYLALLIGIAIIGAAAAGTIQIGALYQRRMAEKETALYRRSVPARAAQLRR